MPSKQVVEELGLEEYKYDFVTEAKPVFKARPLPKSKKEAIDLMMEQPNLIKRPVLVRGSEAIFGFNKDAYKDL